MWGIWIVQSPENGTARLISEIPVFGGMIALLYVSQGTFRLCSGLFGNNHGMRFHSFVGVFSFGMIANTVALAQGVTSALFWMYAGVWLWQVSVLYRIVLEVRWETEVKRWMLHKSI